MHVSSASAPVEGHHHNPGHNHQNHQLQSHGGLGLREASCISPAAFLGSCVGSQGLCTRLLALFCDSTITFLSIPGGDSASTYLSSLLSGGPLSPVDHPSPEYTDVPLKESKKKIEIRKEEC